ncbi:MAG TPA: type II secretion system F family protein, partial [Nitrospiraceae bacterium]|nr:type II secretion system F family protein [Nitrospiraceae bacterium]
MAVFSYTAVDERRNVVRGTVAGASPRQARDELRAKGLAVQTISAESANGSAYARISWAWPGAFGAKVAIFVRELATLLAVGVPLLEGLDTLVRQQRGAMRMALLLLRDEIASGASLAEAMARQPHVFDPLAVSMVEVGEATGNLDSVLEQLAEFKQRSLEFKDRVLTALFYPAIVLSVSLSVSVFLMRFVVPMLLTNLLEARRTLPWPTRVLKGMSDILVDHGAWLLILVIIVAVGIAMGLRTRSGRRLWNRVLLWIPVIGPMARKQEIARMALVVASMMRSGIVFLQSLAIASRSTGNLLMREALDQCHDQVISGRDIGEAMEATGYFPPLVVQVFSVGQKTGRLEEMLQR